MNNFIKMILIAMVNFWVTYAADDMEAHPDRHRPLSNSSITVGCTGLGSYLYCPFGDLTRGPEYLKKEYENVEKKSSRQRNINSMAQRIIGELSPVVQKDNFRYTIGIENEEKGIGITHNHPGITIDTKPAISSPRHQKIDWLNFEEKSKYQDVFLEQLPPAGYKGMDRDFMPKAITKASDMLESKGRLVIYLALDAFADPNSDAAALKNQRLKNPFFFVFNNKMIEMIGQYVKNRQGKPDHFVVRAVSFYEEKFKKLVIDAAGEEIGEKKYKDLYSLENVTSFNIDALQRRSRASEILTTIAELAALLFQEHYMIAYLKDHGFQDAQLEWLDAGSHHYSPSGGWFITAFKKE